MTSSSRLCDYSFQVIQHRYPNKKCKYEVISVDCNRSDKNGCAIHCIAQVMLFCHGESDTHIVDTNIMIHVRNFMLRHWMDQMKPQIKDRLLAELDTVQL